MNQILSPHTGFIRKHWNGDYSFTRSFWINFVLIAWLVPILVSLGQAVIAPTLSPRLSSAAYLSSSIAEIALLIWGALGAARSAKRYRDNGGAKQWSQAALFAISLMAVSTIVPILTAPGLFYANLRMVVTGRYGPPASLKVVDSGATILVHGSLQEGTAAALSNLLDRTTKIATVELDSSGGLLTEAILMANQISTRHLDTLVRRDCFSACTFVFLAGKSRCLGRTANLSFHSGYRVDVAPGVQLPGMKTFQSEHYRAAGLPADFIERILATPYNTLWRPSRAELLTANVITPGCQETAT